MRKILHAEVVGFRMYAFFLVGKSLKKMVESGEGALALRNDSLGSKLV